MFYNWLNIYLKTLLSVRKERNKKIGFRGQKGSTSRGYDQTAQPVEEPVDRLWSSDQGPVEEGQKPSLSQ